MCVCPRGGNIPRHLQEIFCRRTGSAGFYFFFSFCSTLGLPDVYNILSLLLFGRDVYDDVKRQTRTLLETPF